MPLPNSPQHRKEGPFVATGTAHASPATAPPSAGGRLRRVRATPEVKDRS